MENLLVLYNKIQQLSPLPFFCQETIVVQNAGMQHWLNMSIAQSRGISMNIDYALPAQFLWKLLRTVASEEKVPEQSPYSREVLCWRICQLLDTEQVLNDQDFSQVNAYWQGGNPQELPSSQAQLKRYQLAVKVADLYEQYLIFRPQWIDAWCNFTVSSSVAELPEELGQVNHSVWQAKLWQLLDQQLSYNPVELMADAIANLKNHGDLLPKRISFFGINAMAPMWLEFIQALGKHTDIHFFHLNPCVDYWGDIQTEKQLYQKLSQWTEGTENLADEVGNPLLANLGQQGREFISLLQSISAINIDAFEPLTQVSDVINEKASVLHQVQQDILSLKDARQASKKLIDDSIVLTSCHSAFREVQALHDWLLHQLNNDSSLTPKDILVMCPQVEDYAPYINAVFARGWQDISDEVPPLPCSIADRTSSDSDPIVATFSDLLNLPDSRFHISSVISFMRVPAMMAKIKLTSEEVAKLVTWLEAAAVHWGLSQNHKAQILNDSKASGQFSWQQGLDKLLKGFAFSDSEAIYYPDIDSTATLALPHVEGQDGLLLGKLILFIEQLQIHASTLATERTASQWQQYLMSFVDDCFINQGEQSFDIIESAISSLNDHCFHANYHDQISLTVVREYLNNHFATPDPGRQFMVGQVTFCSMLPMRSIPFKVIAILGLNDGEFPRQRTPLAFDLMSVTPAKLGDRSRRGDDRYLFLEAIISARQALYLSYQGRNIKNNTVKQPSIILTELFDYLTQGYGWNISSEQSSDDKQASQLRQMAMQPFSVKNYLGQWASFDANWLKIAQSSQAQIESKNLNEHSSLSNLPCEQVLDGKGKNIETVTILELAQFYQHPAKWFARRYLQLNFDQYQTEIEDVEPFTYDRLASYQLKQDLLAIYLSKTEQQEAEINQRFLKAKLSGQFSDSPSVNQEFEKWQDDTAIFADAIKTEISEEINNIEINLPLAINHQNENFTIEIYASLPICGHQQVFYRGSKAKAKDIFTLYLQQLVLQAAQSTGNYPELANVEQSCGLYFDTQNQKVAQILFKTIEQPQAKLTELITTFLIGQCQPLLLNADLGKKLFESRKFEQADLEKFWHDDNNFQAFGQDPYIDYFWPDCPQISSITASLSQIYQPVFQAITKVKRK